MNTTPDTCHDCGAELGSRWQARFDKTTGRVIHFCHRCPAGTVMLRPGRDKSREADFYPRQPETFPGLRKRYPHLMRRTK